MMTNLSRRGFIFGGAAFAVVSSGVIMPIKSLFMPEPEFELLPPGEYTMVIDDVQIKDNRLLVKMWHHAANYQMSPKLFEAIYRV